MRKNPVFSHVCGIFGNIAGWKENVRLEKKWEGDFLTIEKSVSMAKNREKVNDSDNNFVSVEGSTNNQKARIIELNSNAKATLQRIKDQRGCCRMDDFITITRTGKLNTASNLEHRMKVIMKNAGLEDVNGGLHIFRKTFATRMYESGARPDGSTGHNYPSRKRK